MCGGGTRRLEPVWWNITSVLQELWISSLLTTINSFYGHYTDLASETYWKIDNPTTKILSIASRTSGGLIVSSDDRLMRIYDSDMNQVVLCGTFKTHSVCEMSDGSVACLTENGTIAVGRSLFPSKVHPLLSFFYHYRSHLFHPTSKAPWLRCAVQRYRRVCRWRRSKDWRFQLNWKSCVWGIDAGTLRVDNDHSTNTLSLSITTSLLTFFHEGELAQLFWAIVGVYCFFPWVRSANLQYQDPKRQVMSLKWCTGAEISSWSAFVDISDTTLSVQRASPVLWSPSRSDSSISPNSTSLSMNCLK